MGVHFADDRLILEHIQTGIILDWASELYPENTSRWLVLNEVRHDKRREKRFEVFCIYSSIQKDQINGLSVYTFNRKNIHRFRVKSQI